jgi:hypothetical protein
VVNNDWGGKLNEYRARWQQVADAGNPVEVRGWCVSGCTLVAAYIPKERLCFRENAALFFHQVRTLETGEWLPADTLTMVSQFPAESACALTPLP